MAEAEGKPGAGRRGGLRLARRPPDHDGTGGLGFLPAGLPPGGWAFQYENAYYPDVDDTAVVAMLLHRGRDPAHADAIERARTWIIGMQSRNGGWGAFDVDNDYQFLNYIPFADHGALLDPPTVT